MNGLIVGASAGLGLALARKLAEAGYDLLLVSSDDRDLQAVAADLRIRHRRRVATVAVDVADTEGYLEAVARAAADLGGLDVLMFPVAVMAEGDDGHLAPADAERLLRVNLLAVAATIARFGPALRSRPAAAMVGFGSVAAARGRGANVVYSASKRALQSLFESVRHAYAGTPVVVQLYVPGYLETNLAFGRRTALPRARPDALAGRVLRDLGRDFGQAYYPGYWRWLCLVLRLLPWPLFRRLAF